MPGILINSTVHRSKPKKPLKILTIDGGGLQAISTLLILDKLLDTIAKTNKAPNLRPRPCDVFDVIAGIGAGGWLALLLGRFHMDITSCLSEWYNITQCIAPRSKAEELRMRVFQHCYFDTDRLMSQIDELTSIYGTGPDLIDNDKERSRCRHVFVAALETNPKNGQLKYNLFRTYRCPEGANLLGGPENPQSYKISRAFAVTGAAKYFTPPWKEHMENGSKIRFMDTKYPKPHNITELALNEMWGLYGTDVQISVVVNIGPGKPDQSDVIQIARRFSFGIGLASPYRPQLWKRSRSPAAEETGANKRRTTSMLIENSTTSGPEHQVQFLEEPSNSSRPFGTSTEDDSKHSMTKRTTFGSVVGIDINEKLKRAESKIEKDIRAKLKYIYPNDTPPYFRLAPEHAPRGTARNDASAPGVTHNATDKYLQIHNTSLVMDEVSRRIPLEVV